MRFRRIHILIGRCPIAPVVLFSLFLSSCLSLPQVGDEGQPCSDKGACNEGLVCSGSSGGRGAGNICIKAGAEMDGGVPQGDGGRDSGTAADSGLDSGTDAAVDAGPDAAFDSGVDSSFDDAQDGSHPSDASDAGFDGGFDTGADIGDDAGQDAGADAGLDGGGDAGTGPVITSIDGDGTTSAVVDEGGVVTGLPGRLDATHRFQKKWVVTGDRLDTVTDAKLEKSGGGVVFTAADGLVFESGGTAMQRNLLLPAALVTGAFALTLGNGAGDATAQVYVLQGEKGDQGIGLKGDKGDTGTQGPAGVSVAAASEAPGANCTYGGVKYTSTSGDTYVCNGAPGSQGTKGDTGS